MRGTWEAAEAKGGVHRVAVLARGTDGLLRRCGWIRVLTIWRPPGRTTMRGLSGRGVATHKAMEEERARRHFASAEDIDREIKKYRIDVVDTHLRALLELLSPDAMRREATRLFILRTADELAGEGASAILRQVALSVTLFDLESHVASGRLLASAARGVPHSGLVHWRASAELRLNAKLKTLSYVRSMEESSLRSSLTRLRLAAG